MDYEIMIQNLKNTQKQLEQQFHYVRGQIDLLEQFQKDEKLKQGGDE